MLCMCRRLSVERHNSPLIAERPGFMRSEVQHRLDSEAVSGANTLFRSLPPVIGYLRRFVHMSSDSMARVIANDPVAKLLRMLLNGPTNVTYSVIDSTTLNAKLKTLTRHANEIFQSLRDLADWPRHRGAADNPLVCRRHIERNNIALIQRIFF